jgi:electron transport complex protein RnfC
VQYYRYAKTEAWAHEQDKRKAEHAKARHTAKLERQERQERERQAKLRNKKDAAKDKPAPKAPAEASPGAPAQTSAPVPGQADAIDPKKAAIEAAKARAAAKKAALAEQGVVPKNTEGLRPAQQRQVEVAETRRRAAGLSEGPTEPQPPTPAETADPKARPVATQQEQV